MELPSRSRADQALNRHCVGPDRLPTAIDPFDGVVGLGNSGRPGRSETSAAAYVGHPSSPVSVTPGTQAGRGRLHEFRVSLAINARTRSAFPNDGERAPPIRRIMFGSRSVFMRNVVGLRAVHLGNAPTRVANCCSGVSLPVAVKTEIHEGHPSGNVRDPCGTWRRPAR